MSLVTILDGLAKRAYRHIDEHQMAMLSKGLGVEMYVDALQNVHLMIWREGVFPADVEWTAVMRCWPIPVYPVPEPTMKQTTKRRALVAIFKTPKPNPFNQEDRTQHEQSNDSTTGAELAGTQAHLSGH